MDNICGGELPNPEEHDRDFNTHRLCLRFDENECIDLQVNKTDLGWLRWVLDALDGESTSWLSKRAKAPVTDGEK